MNQHLTGKEAGLVVLPDGLRAELHQYAKDAPRVKFVDARS